jgi:pyruvate formate lyase activating enzyme
MKREAILYERLQDDAARCNICQRRCKIPNGSTGFCMTRENQGGKLYSLIYGDVSSISVNPIEKKPVYHFLPGSRWLSLGSMGCNFRCPGCQNWSIAHWRGGPMGTQYISPQDLVSRALASGCRGISWTFNEPALWLEYTLDAAKLAKQKGLYTNYVTNGFLTEEAFDRIAPFLDVYRVDVKGFSDESYRKVAGAKGFEGVSRIAERAKDYGLHVEIVTNVILGHNDNEADLRGIAFWIRERLGLDTPWHVTRFYPHHELVSLHPTPIETLERAWAIGKEEGLWYVYLGNVPGHQLENTYCHSCKALIIERYLFDVIKSGITNGRCPECGSVIPGRFEG